MYHWKDLVAKQHPTNSTTALSWLEAMNQISSEKRYFLVAMVQPCATRWYAGNVDMTAGDM